MGLNQCKSMTYLLRDDHFGETILRGTFSSTFR